jgi:hypothetical protein
MYLVSEECEVLTEGSLDIVDRFNQYVEVRLKKQIRALHLASTEILVEHAKVPNESLSFSIQCTPLTSYREMQMRANFKEACNGFLSPESVYHLPDEC